MTLSVAPETSRHLNLQSQTAGWEREGEEEEERDPLHHTSLLTLRVSPFTLQPPITSLSVLTHTCTFSYICWYLPLPKLRPKLRNWWSGRRRLSLDSRTAVSNRVAIKKIARGDRNRRRRAETGEREKTRKTASGDRVAMEAHGMRD